jgi:PAS domain S-box-containing protein
LAAKLAGFPGANGGADFADEEIGVVPVFLDDPEIFRNVVDNLQTGIYLTDCERRIVFWNQGAEHITGYKRHEVVGRFCRDNILMHCNEAGAVLCEAECPLAESIRDGKQKEGQLYLRHKTGHQVPVKVWTMAIRNARGAIIGAAESFEVRNPDSEQERHQSTLAAHGCLDMTTGLPNHGLTRSHLRESLVLFAEHHLPFGVLCIQLDELVEFEGAHSYEAMHAILHVSARTVAHVLGPTAFLGRWAENQFLAILPECDRVELEKLRHEIHRVVNCSGIRWWGDPLSTRASVGWAMVEPDDTVESVVGRALQDLGPASAGQQSQRRPVPPTGHCGGES